MDILIVNDDRRLSDAIKSELKDEQSNIQYVNDKDSYTLVLNKPYDLIVLDWTHHTKNGLSALQKIRAEGVKTPVLMLTAEYAAEDIIMALDSGANSCLAMPVDTRVLISRMKAIIRRGKLDRGAVINCANIRLDPVSHKVWKKGEFIELTCKEYGLLLYFMQHPNQVLTRNMISENVWGQIFSSLTNCIDVYVNYLRNKIDDDLNFKLIHSIRNEGYIFKTI